MTVSPEARSWKEHRPVESRPRVRIAVVFVLLTLPLGIILARLHLLQQETRPEPTVNITESVIALPARTGRILSADGVVLAEDATEYELWVSFRRIEDPIDDRWLTREASRLRRQDRSGTLTMGEAKRQVLARQTALWNAIGELTRTDPNELQDARKRITRRIHRIRSSVRDRRTTQQQQTRTVDANRSWAERIRHELSSPPKRARGPLVVREELEPHPVLTRLPVGVAAQIEAHPERFPGCEIRQRLRRQTPQGQLAAHVIGRRSASEGGIEGVTGLERAYDRVLTGEPGRQRITQRGDSVLSTETEQPPRPGLDLTLTLHAGLQKEAERLLQQTISTLPASNSPHGGVAVLMDIHTGAVLTLASVPTFDAETPPSQPSDATNRPFFPRGHRMALPPGSVFKIIPAVAALQSGLYSPDDEFYCRGYLDTPRANRCLIYRRHGVGHGRLSLTTALAKSCNVCFFQVGRRLGSDPLTIWAERFGFGEATGIDLPGEASGHLPGPTRESKRWTRADTLALSIGQSRLLVTPLQVARMMAAVANGGTLVTPHLVASDRVPAPTRIPDLSLETLAIVRGGLDAAVNSPEGTGYRTIRHDDIRIAGKTGTAEVGGSAAEHAWFAGYLPADRPRYVIVTVIEHGGSGGRVAGPVANRLVDAMLKQNLLPGRSAEEDETTAAGFTASERSPQPPSVVDATTP